MIDRGEVFEFTKLSGEAVKIRTVLRNGEPWLVASDVCRVLRIDRSKGLLKLGPDEKVVSNTSLNRGSPPVLINEAGLYRLIMRCDKADARPFQDWVTKTVLPTIRKEKLGTPIRSRKARTALLRRLPKTWA